YIFNRVESTRFFNSQEDKKMSELIKDVFIGLLFMTGILGFVAGEFIISTTLFASAAISSNVILNRRLKSAYPNH
ncbi:MAG: hypothetical protein ABL925_09650, partial [Methylococcales bacterium]